MPSRDDEPKPDLDDELDLGKRVSFRDYPSTGVVVLAALVSGLSWMAYKWSRGKRSGPSASNGRQHEEGMVPRMPASGDEGASAEPKRDLP
jgi:hypothetical protein